MKIQVIGLGGIGKNLLRLIHQKNGTIKSKIGEKIEVVSVSDSSGTVITEDLSLLRIIEAKESGGLREIDSFEKISALKAIEDIDADLVVEVTQSTPDGYPGITHVLKAMENEKDVVTANKSILVSEMNMFEKAAEFKRMLRYEATVCGSIPVFNLIDYSIIPANIISVQGYFNATSSFIISRMENGMSKEAAISEAVKIGLAEKNYSDDLEGIDSARKGIILHRRIFNSNISLKDVKFKNIKDGLVPGNRLFTEVNRNGVEVSYKSVGNNRPEIQSTKAPMSITFITDLYDTLTLSIENDGPLESAAATLNDIILIGKEKKLK